MISKSSYSGASITISIVINDDVDLNNGFDMKVYLGGTLIGSLLDNTPPINVSGIYYDIKLSGSDTILHSGYKDISIVLIDYNGIGVKKALIGGVEFNRLPFKFTSNSKSNTRDLILELKNIDLL